jgi:mono/diheme cytochrome c family protein
MKLHTCLLTAALLVAPVMPALANAPAAVAAKPAAPAKPDLVQGEARFTAACASCHVTGLMEYEDLKLLLLLKNFNSLMDLL